MGNIKIDIDVLNKRVDEDIEDDIQDGIEKGGTSLGLESEDIAQHRIRSVGAIFSGDLITNFDVDVKEERGMMIVTLKNRSDHAEPIEYGAEYTERGPPVAALIPWVRTKMSGFQVPDDELANLPDPEDVDEDTEVPEPGGGKVDVLDIAAPETIEKAFWLQQHIKQNGIDAVRFMRAAQEYAREEGPSTVADYISRELRT